MIRMSESLARMHLRNEVSHAYQGDQETMAAAGLIALYAKCSITQAALF
jgi:hypothetical protein